LKRVLLRKQLLTFLTLGVVDLLAFGLAIWVGLAIRALVLPGVSELFTTQVIWRIEYFWFLMLGIFVFLYEGLYTKRRTLWEEFRFILRGMTVTLVLFLALMTLVKSGAEVSRPAIVITYFFAPGVVAGLRNWVKKRCLPKTTFWSRRVLIAGLNDDSLQLARQLECFPELGCRVVGFLGDAELAFPSVSCLGRLNDLERVVAEHPVDELIIALPGESRPRQFELLTTAEALVPRISVLPEIFDVDKLNVEIDKVERYFLLSFQNNLMKKSNRFAKSVFEVLAVLVLAPAWVPLFLILSLAVKGTSSGPVFYRQQRIGRNGKPFWCYKFRTMVADAESFLDRHFSENPTAQSEWEADRKLRDDPRITTVGRILRRSSLDELPQIINILRGEMSLVGPRPIVKEEITRYEKNFRYYISVCPGLTGLWQVSGRNDVGYAQRVMLDTFYVRNWSLWLDFMILLRTVPAVLKKDGAY
jgi:undecaprenyl-phosphate galactose phosphotransferase